MEWQITLLYLLIGAGIIFLVTWAFLYDEVTEILGSLFVFVAIFAFVVFLVSFLVPNKRKGCGD